MNAAALATQGSDYEAIRAFVLSLYFSFFGTVDKVVDETHVDIRMWYTEHYSGPSILKNVELMSIGNALFSITAPADKGDIVLVLGVKHPVDVLSEAQQKDEFCASGQSYTLGTVKALVIKDNTVTPKASLVVDKDGNITINNKLKVLV